PQGGSSLFEQLRDGLSSGSVLVTNGPFIRLLVNGKYPPGSFVTDTDGMLDVLLEVHAAPWVDVRSVMLYESEFFIRQVLLPQSERLRRLPRSDADSPEYRLPLKRDMVITAMALGYTPLSPVVAQDDLRGFDERPLAITGPIFIDADGDGKCTPPDLREVYGTGNKLQEMLRK
ncbi:hypothetical protein FJY63_12240, partial [Candidatus Sumerlaeota bacterium]|nr:hypothetical protein [Candidatus Sumerlaeota bacterium]